MYHDLTYLDHQQVSLNTPPPWFDRGRTKTDPGMGTRNLGDTRTCRPPARSPCLAAAHTEVNKNIMMIRNCTVLVNV